MRQRREERSGSRAGQMTDTLYIDYDNYLVDGDDDDDGD